MPDAGTDGKVLLGRRSWESSQQLFHPTILLLASTAMEDHTRPDELGDVSFSLTSFENTLFQHLQTL